MHSLKLLLGAAVAASAAVIPADVKQVKGITTTVPFLAWSTAVTTVRVTASLPNDNVTASIIPSFTVIPSVTPIPSFSVIPSVTPVPSFPAVPSFPSVPSSIPPFTTTVKISTTISIPTATPIPSVPSCFKIKISGPSWLSTGFLGIDQSSLLKLAYKWESSVPSIFYVDKAGFLRTATDNTMLMRSTINLFSPSYGYISKVGVIPITASLNKATKSLDLGTSVFGFKTAASSVAAWASSFDTGIILGTCPDIKKYTAIVVKYEECICPATAVLH